MNSISLEDKTRIIYLLCEGNGIRSISRITGCAKGTIQKLQRDVYNNVLILNEKLLIDVNAATIEADELMTMVSNKDNGTKWIYVGMDRETRVIIDFHVGDRRTKDARIFLKKISDRLDFISEVNTDALKSYISAVGDTPHGFIWSNKQKIDLVRARNMGTVTRYCTNRVETHNGQLRQHISRLTRRTRCFSKQIDKLIEHLTIYFFYYNFIKKHKSLKTCPGVAGGLVDKPMKVSEMIPKQKTKIYANQAMPHIRQPHSLP